MSSSSLSGKIIVGSLVICIELFFDVLEPGVAGPEFRGNGGSEFWRRRAERPNRSPKLFRPVEVEVRPDAGRVGVGRLSSLGMFRRELSVDDLPRCPSLFRVGEDMEDAADSFLNKDGTPVAANADDDFAIAL